MKKAAKTPSVFCAMNLLYPRVFMMHSLRLDHERYFKFECTIRTRGCAIKYRTIRIFYIGHNIRTSHKIICYCLSVTEGVEVCL